MCRFPPSLLSPYGGPYLDCAILGLVFQGALSCGLRWVLVDGIGGDCGGGDIDEGGGEFVVGVGEGDRPCVLWFSVVDVVVEVVVVLLSFGGEEQECIVEVVWCWVVFVV